MRVFVFSFCVAWGQTEGILLRADSLRQAGRYEVAWPLYDSLLRTVSIGDSVYLQALLGGGRCLVELRKWEFVAGVIERGESLAVQRGDTLTWAEFRVLRGRVLYGQRKYKEAQKVCEDVIEVYGRQGLGVSVAYGSVLQLVGTIYQAVGSYREADSLYHQAREKVRRTVGTQHPAYASVLNSLGNLYWAQGRYAEAESMYVTCRELRANVLGREHLDYARVLSNLGGVYRAQGRYAEAESMYVACREIRAKILGREHPEYVQILNNLGVLYWTQGRYVEAESMYVAYREIGAKFLGQEHPEYAQVLNNLGILYVVQGRYVEAESMYVMCREIRAKVLGREHPDYAKVFNNLGLLYQEQGQYIEAESVFVELQGIWAKVLGRDHPYYAAVLNNLGILYEEQGRYVEAESMYVACREVRAKVLGREHPEYARVLNNLGTLYEKQERYVEAESMYVMCREVWVKILGREHPSYAKVLHNLGVLYEKQGRYVEAESMYVACREILAKVLGQEHPSYAMVLANLGILYIGKALHERAEVLLRESLFILERSLGKKHPSYVHNLISLAELYDEYRKDWKQADSLWREGVALIFERIQREFPAMPTAHRQQLMENILVDYISDFQRHVAKQGGAMVEVGYLSARGVKGLLLSSSEGMRYLVEASTDSTVKGLYKRWQRIAEQYAFYLSQEKYQVADSLYRVLNEWEKALVARLPELRAYFPDLEREPLYPTFGREEAVIEMVRVLAAERSDSVLYLLYVITRRGKGYGLSLHVRAVDTLWERRVLNAYEILRSPYAEVRGTAYKLLWGWVDSLLPKGVKRVYFSPDGVYYRVNVGSLYDEGRRAYVMDRYEVRYISSSRRLMMEKPKGRGQKSEVIGNPSFYKANRQVEVGRVRGYRSFPYGIPSLPGAEVEARTVAGFLGTEAVIGSAATEGYMRSLRSPRILHIATHGYFSGEGRNPYMKAGLLLAGAGLWDSLYVPGVMEDGKLTAQEVLSLNLLGTELVVLSACETGLGEVRGEGLYGLSRAFLEAGAQAVISALWQVDDEATRELMERFYRAWVKRGKRSVEEVWRAVVRDFRRKYPLPYYWGAFIVMR